ncbi:MAG: rRNA maturation RNase YbeY [Phycisphaerales bacterium]|nr:rRNA maturation RNase YbeY [Phycisphaerales bacterium]
MRRVEASGSEEGGGRKLAVAVAWRLRRPARGVALLQRAARHVANAEGFCSGELSIAVVGARAMATLHARFLGLPGPTDVITFDLGTDRQRGVLDGEVVVCRDVAARAVPAAQRTAQAVAAELTLYVVHGVLHLAGYDDQSPQDYAAMHAREDELLGELGLGAVFARCSRTVR